MVSHLASFVIVCEAFHAIKTNKDLFRWLFEVKSRKVHPDGGALGPMGGMNIEVHYGYSRSYPCLSLRSSNSGWHGNWFYIHDDDATPSLPSPASCR